MRYLKPYNIFESLDGDLVSNISDMLLEITDLGYRYDFAYGGDTSNNDALDIQIMGPKNSVAVDDIIDTVLRMNEYMRSKGFTFEKFKGQYTETIYRNMTVGPGMMEVIDMDKKLIKFLKSGRNIRGYLFLQWEKS